MIRKLEHVGIFVDNLDRSVAFYRDVLGMTLQKTVKMPSGNELAFLGFDHAPETVVELVAGEHSELAEIGRVHHLAFTVDSIEEAIERLQGHGVEWMQETPSELPDGTRYMFFYGPDREHLELFQPPR